MSLRDWKKLAESRTKAGKMKNQLYDQITAEKIKSKTSDAAITKAFRLDEIIEGLKGKPGQKRPPRIRPVRREDGGIDYAPVVDPYEDMDVEGLLNLEDYVGPQAEKQIAPKPPKYQMDPSLWQIDPGPSGLSGPSGPPPGYDEIDFGDDGHPPAVEAPPDGEEDEDEGEVEEGEEFEGEEDQREANKILDHLELPNYDDVEMRLGETEMTGTKQRNYLNKVVKDAELRRRQVIAKKSDATKKF